MRCLHWSRRGSQYIGAVTTWSYRSAVMDYSSQETGRLSYLLHSVTSPFLKWQKPSFWAGSHWSVLQSHWDWLFPVCNLSPNNYAKNATWLLDSSCLLASSVIPFQSSDYHGTLQSGILLCRPCIRWKLGWTYSLTAKGSLSSLPGPWAASKVRSDSGGKAPSTLGSFAGQLVGFCRRKGSVLPLLNTVATVYCCGSARKMLPVSHGNLELSWNKLWANPAVLIHALCDLPLTPAAKPTAEEQQWSEQALTDARFYLWNCYSVVACS